MQMNHVDQCTDTSTCEDCGVNIAADRKCLWNSNIFNLPPGLVNITLFNEMVIQPLANWITVNTSNVGTSCCKVAPEPEAFPEGGLTCRIIPSHHHCNNNNIQQRDSREEERWIKQAHLHTSLIFFNRLEISRLQVLHPRILSAKRLWKLQWLQVQDLQTSVVTDISAVKYCESEYTKIISSFEYLVCIKDSQNFKSTVLSAKCSR